MALRACALVGLVALPTAVSLAANTAAAAAANVVVVRMHLMPNCDLPIVQLGLPVATCPRHTTTASSTGPSGGPLWDSGSGANNGSGSGVNAANDGSSLVPGLPDTGASPEAVVSRFRGVLLVGVGFYVLTAIGSGLALAPRR